MEWDLREAGRPVSLGELSDFAAPTVGLFDGLDPAMPEDAGHVVVAALLSGRVEASGTRRGEMHCPRRHVVIVRHQQNFREATLPRSAGDRQSVPTSLPHRTTLGSCMIAYPRAPVSWAGDGGRARAQMHLLQGGAGHPRAPVAAVAGRSRPRRCGHRVQPHLAARNLRAHRVRPAAVPANGASGLRELHGAG